MAMPISGTADKYFLWDVKGKLCSKFGEDRSKTKLNLGRNCRLDGHRMDGRTDGRMDGRTDGR